MKNSIESKVIKCQNYEWDRIENHSYKTDGTGYHDIHRASILVDDSDELNFHTRYFEIQGGGYTSLEYHQHSHSVVIIRGSGSVILDNDLHILGLHDVIYISPGTIHQFHADQSGPLGFICIVDRHRDKPVVPKLKSVREKIQNPEVFAKIRI